MSSHLMSSHFVSSRLVAYRLRIISISVSPPPHTISISVSSPFHALLHTIPISSPSHLMIVSSHLVSSHLISSPSCRVAYHLRIIPICISPPSHTISSSISSPFIRMSIPSPYTTCIMSHVVSSRLVSSHQISSHIAPIPHQYAIKSSRLVTGMGAWLGQTKYSDLSPQLKAKIDKKRLKWASVRQKIPFEYHLGRIHKGEAQRRTKRASRQGTAPHDIKNLHLISSHPIFMSSRPHLHLISSHHITSHRHLHLISSHPHLQLISSHLMFISSPCHLIPISISFHLHLHLISSPYPSHLISISSHLHVISPSHLHLMCISSHLISSHLISSHLVWSHLVSSRLISSNSVSHRLHTTPIRSQLILTRHRYGSMAQRPKLFGEAQ